MEFESIAPISFSTIQSVSSFYTYVDTAIRDAQWYVPSYQFTSTLGNAIAHTIHTGRASISDASVQLPESFASTVAGSWLSVYDLSSIQSTIVGTAPERSSITEYVPFQSGDTLQFQLRFTPRISTISASQQQSVSVGSHITIHTSPVIPRFASSTQRILCKTNFV
jgi:hypothetical protein